MEFAEALKGDLLVRDAHTDAAIIPALSIIVNSFGNHNEEISEAVMQSDTTRKNFLLVASACMVALGYTRKCEDMGRGHWDDRNKASSRYCKEHLDDLLQMFEDAAGFLIRFKENPMYQYFQQDTLLGRLDTKGMQIAAEVEAFLREHPTLQQSMVGVFLRVILKNDLYPVSFDEQVFPFI